MSAFDAADLAVLAPENNRGYGTWQLPCERDTEIAELLDRLDQPGDLAGLRGLLDTRYSTVLLAFAERMASLARRDRTPSHLRRGLLAAGLAASIGDQREATLVLPLLWRTAEILDLDPAHEFTSINERIGGPGGKQLTAFASRSSEDQSIESMGYIEDRDETGFRYRRTW